MPARRLDVRLSCHYTRVFRDAFGNFLAGLDGGRIGKLRVSVLPKSEGIANCAGLRRPGLNQRSRQRTPLELQPDSSLDGIEMQCRRVGGSQMQVRLYLVKQLVR